MIIKACERGGGARLAVHLLNEQDNEHIEVHEVRGFLSQNLKGAMNEAHAVAQGTRCKKYLFSVILSPPTNENPTIDDYKDAAQLIEEKMKLGGQPRSIVFHEKEGRRHAHAVWSRIDAREMKAINLPYYKNKLNEIAKDLYLEHGWDLPKGFLDREMSNPLNYSREEWQQAKRINEDPRIIKAALQDCWAKAKTKEAFEQLLEKRGFYLARGDRRGYVAVDWRGEVFSLTRALKEKKKALQDKLGDASELPSLDEAKQVIDQKLASQVQQLTGAIQSRYQDWLAPMLAKRSRMKDQHQTAREDLRQSQEARAKKEAAKRQARYSKGLRGLWDRLRGKHSKIRKQNEAEAKTAMLRDRVEKEALIARQLKQRQHLQRVITKYHDKCQQELKSMQEVVFSKLPEESVKQYQKEFDRDHAAPLRGFDLGM